MLGIKFQKNNTKIMNQFIFYIQFMFTAIFSVFSGASFFYLGYNYAQIKKWLQTPRKVRIHPPNHTFFPETVTEYTELINKKYENKYVIYSKYHKCALSTHQLVNQQTLDKQIANKTNQKEIAAQNVLNSQSSATFNQVQIQQKVEQKPSQSHEKKKKELFERLYKDYASQLIQNKTCNSVQLIYGPIFSKDTRYKVDKQIIKSVYTSHVKVASNGEWLTDRFYTVVICNRNQGSYFNAFSQRKSNFPTFRFLNYLTSLKKLEEQTGLVFNVHGQTLTRIDYNGIAKERTFENTELASKQGQNLQQQQNQ